MDENSRPSRERILAALRAGRPPLVDVPDRPGRYLPVTPLDDGEDLIARFKAELERLNGYVHVCASEADAVRVVLEVVGVETRVMAWQNLPLPGLAEALTTSGVEVILPMARGADRFAAYAGIESVKIGITGADAAFATTGTLVLLTNDAQGRIPSLLPGTHVALLRRERLYPRPEDWLSDAGRRALLGSNSVTFITGPSRTGDIEMQIILGVHGPGAVHAVVF